jgi:hypothetical protein
MMSGGMMSGGMMSGGMMSGGMMSGGMMSGGYEGGDTNDDDYGVSHHSIDICSIAKTQLVCKILTRTRTSYSRFHSFTERKWWYDEWWLRGR